MMNDSLDDFESFCKNVHANENDTTDEMWELGEYRMNGIVLAVFQTIFLLIGLPWNLMVIVTIVKEKLYKQPTIVLLLNLVITELLYLITLVPLFIVVGSAGEFILGSNDSMRCNSCVAIALLGIPFPTSIIYAIALLSLDRFFYFYKPLHYEKIITVPRISIAISVIWVSAFITASIPLFEIETLFKNIFFHRSLGTCVPNFLPTGKLIIVLLIMICLPLIVLIVCNVLVICLVYKTIKQVYSVRKMDQDTDFLEKVKEIRQKKQFHLIKVFGGLMISSLISWLPLVILAILFSTKKDRKDYETVPTPFQVIALLLYNAQAVIHPILETILIRDVRKPLKQIFFCCVNRRNSGEHTTSSATCSQFLKVCPRKVEISCSCENVSCWRLAAFCVVISEKEEICDTNNHIDVRGDTITTFTPTSYVMQSSPHTITPEEPSPNHNHY